jgi:hypothetical protein
MGTGSFLGVKWPERGVDHPPPYSAEVKQRVELYLFSTSGPVIGLLLPLRKVQPLNVYGGETKKKRLCEVSPHGLPTFPATVPTPISVSMFPVANFPTTKPEIFYRLFRYILYLLYMIIT